MTTAEIDTLIKHIILEDLEVTLATAQTAAGVGSLSEIETTLADLSAALVTDPESIDEAQIQAVATQLQAFAFQPLTDISDLLTSAT